MSVTTTNVRRALTLFQSIVTLQKALTSDQCAEGQEAVEAARLDLEAIQGALEALGPVGEIRHTYQPRSTEIDVDVAITTTGRTLAVKVGAAAQAGESDEAVRRRAQALSLQTVEETVAIFEAAGIRFGKAEAGSR